MLMNLALPTLAMIAVLPAPQQDAGSIIATAAQKQAERWASVTDYSVEMLVEGAFPAPQYYEKNVVDGSTTFRLVPVNEWMQKATGTQALSAENFDTMAVAYERLGSALGSEVGPLGPYVQSMTNEIAMFYRFTAEAERSGAAYMDEDVDAPNVRGMAEFARHARLVGTETVDGRQAFLIRADELSGVGLMAEPGSDSKFIPTSISLWMDTEHYVPLRMMTEGEVETDGKRSPLTLEVLYQDYKRAGPLYEAGRQVLRMSGMMDAMAMDPKQKAEMEKLQADTEKLKAEIASMPANVQGMVRGQLDRALERLEMMTSGDVIEAIIESTIIGVNEGPPINWKPRLPGGG